MYYRHIEESEAIEEIKDTEATEENKEAGEIEPNGARYMSNSYSVITLTLVLIAGMKCLE